MAADIGHGYLNIGGGSRSSGGCSRCGSGFGFGCCSRSGSGACTGSFHQHNHIAFGNFVAHFHFHFFHHTGGIGRYVHGGFVGFQGNQGVVQRDGVTGFNFHGNNIYILVSADIGDFDFYNTHKSSFWYSVGLVN